MDTDILSKFIDLPPDFKETGIMVGTKYFYEFNMLAIRVSGEWYALVSGADPSREEDIDEVIDEEFGAKVEGWCILKSKQHGKRLV